MPAVGNGGARRRCRSSPCGSWAAGWRARAPTRRAGWRAPAATRSPPFGSAATNFFHASCAFGVGRRRLGHQRDQADEIFDQLPVGLRRRPAPRPAPAPARCRGSWRRSSASIWHQSRRACRWPNVGAPRRAAGAADAAAAHRSRLPPRRTTTTSRRPACRGSRRRTSARAGSRPATCGGRRGTCPARRFSLALDQLAGARRRQHQRRHQPRPRRELPRSAGSPATAAARRDPAGRARTATPSCPGDACTSRSSFRIDSGPCARRLARGRAASSSSWNTCAIASERSESASSLQISAAFSTPKRCMHVILKRLRELVVVLLRGRLQHGAHVVRVVLAQLQRVRNRQLGIEDRPARQRQQHAEALVGASAAPGSTARSGSWTGSRRARCASRCRPWCARSPARTAPARPRSATAGTARSTSPPGPRHR